MRTIINQKCAFKIFIITMIFLSSSIFLLQLQTITNPKLLQKPYAYVFYVTEAEYACYAGVNVDRLIDDLATDLSRIDILFLYTTTEWRFKQALTTCSRPEVKLLQVPEAPEGITRRDLYSQSYVRFEAFRLTQYERIIILDADGLIVRNLDHLFTMPLDGHKIGASLAYYLPYNWLSSVVLVVEPSLALYNHIRSYLTPDGIREVSVYANGSHFDMDVLNYVLRSGRNAKLISSGYGTLDSAFVEKGRDSMDGIYYVHFSARKPLNDVLTSRKDAKMNKQAQWIYETFWKGFEKRCKPVLQESVKMALEHLDMMERESKLDEDVIAKFKSHY